MANSIVQNSTTPAPTPSSSNLFLNGSYPLWMVQAVKGLSTSQEQTLRKAHYWISQPRLMQDPHIEILYIDFRQPVSISQVSFSLLQISQSYEIYYYDRNNNRKQLLDTSLYPVSGKISTGTISSWYPITIPVYPVIATKLEVRLFRVSDSFTSATTAYSLGVQNLLIKRNILTAKDVALPLPQGTDPLGNLVVRTVKQYSPLLALNGNSTNYWKSEPQPDPSAVVWFAVDCRDSNSNAVKMDKCYLNPVYTGQHLNIYYSNDDSIGTRQLGNTQLSPTIQTNCQQVQGSGLYLNNTSADYEVTVKDLGLVAGSSFWGGLFWKPQFSSSSPPGSNLVLFQDTASPTPTVQVVYEVFTSQIAVLIAGSLVLQSNAINFNSGDSVGIAISAVYPSDANTTTGLTSGLYLFTNVKGSYSTYNVALTPSSSLNLLNTIKFSNIEGYLQQIILKQETPLLTIIQQFLSDPTTYLTPDPVLSNAQGQLPQTTLSNAVFGWDATLQPFPYGGLDSEFFAEKTWTPIWKDYVTQKGFYYFPKPIVAKYLKFEFTQLTQSPYTVYDSGIQVKYSVFPVSVTTTKETISKQYTASVKTYAGSRTSTSPKAARSLNKSFANSSDSYPQDVTISLGRATVVTGVPNQYTSPTYTSIVKETASSTVYRGTQIDTRVIAQSKYYTVVSGDYLIKIASKYKVPWASIYNANKATIDNDPNIKLLPQRTPGWWIFPGQMLRVPTTTMQKLTSTTTVTERKTTTQVRQRFTTSTVHQYDVQTVTRDSAIAYFAGISDIQLYRQNFITASDTEEYQIQQYDSFDFTLTNVTVNTTTGAATPTVPPDPFTGIVDGGHAPGGASSTVDGGSSSPPPTSILDGGSSPSSVSTTILSNVWNSTSEFIKIKFNAIGKLPLIVVGSLNGVQPVGLNTVGAANWSDNFNTWGSTSAYWGAAESLVSVSFQTNVTYGGQSAILISRQTGSGIAGLQTSQCSLIQGSLVRVGAQIYPPNTQTGNTYILQLVDASNNNAVVFQQQVFLLPGQWNTVTTNYNVLASNYSNLAAQLLVSGSVSEDDYVGNLFIQASTISYQVSNNGGANFYDCTGSATDYLNTNDYFTFPSPGNQLQVKVTMYDSTDFVYGFSLIPTYLSA